MNYKYVTVDRIFSKLIRDFRDELDESDVVEWCGEALEFIGAAKMYEEAVAFVEIKDHQCQLPKGLHAIIQVAKNRCWTPNSEETSLCAKDVVTDLSTSFVKDTMGESGCGLPAPGGQPTTPDYIVLDCNGQPMNDYEIAYYRPYFDVKSYYVNWTSSSMYGKCYSPVRLATHTLFNSLVCKEHDSDSLYCGTKDEYTVVQGTILRTSFREGSLAIAYLRQVVDTETGYPMIPDHISYTTAITKYVTMKTCEREFYNGREGADKRFSKAEEQWHWYCKQAGNVDMMPNGVDEYQNLLDQRSYLLPRNNRYYGFFGNLAKPEFRKYNDPDNRNRNFYALTSQINSNSLDNGNR